ncbi:MAG: hypothetical protein ACK53Y_23405, partial [bacterium]
SVLQTKLAQHVPNYQSYPQYNCMIVARFGHPGGVGGNKKPTRARVITVSDLPLKGKQSARMRTRWLSKKVSSPCCTTLR